MCKRQVRPGGYIEGCAVSVTVGNRCVHGLGWLDGERSSLSGCLFVQRFVYIRCNVAPFLLRFALPQEQAAQYAQRISRIMFPATTANSYQLNMVNMVRYRCYLGLRPW